MTANAICNISDIPVGEARAFAVEGAQVAVFRGRDGSVRAIAAACPHRGGPLADGLADEEVVVCPLHGYTFELATGCERTLGELSVPTYATAVDDSGAVSISLAAAGPG